MELVNAAKSFTLYLSPNDEASVTKSSNLTALPLRYIYLYKSSTYVGYFAAFLGLKEKNHFLILLFCTMYECKSVIVLNTYAGDLLF